MNSFMTSRKFWLTALSFLTIGFTALVFLWLSKTKPLPVLGEAGEFQLTERSGRIVRRDELAEKVWIANFIFTRCGGICPMMTAKMRDLQNELRGLENIRFVSFSVDPERDTPEVLQKYAGHFSADKDKWLFLTGDKEQLFKLSEQHFRLGVSDIPEDEREAADQSVNHSSKFVLVDRGGKIRNYYDSEDAAAMRRLAEDAKLLARGLSN